VTLKANQTAAAVICSTVTSGANMRRRESRHQQGALGEICVDAGLAGGGTIYLLFARQEKLPHARRNRRAINVKEIRLPAGESG
jgi:hypothetical protein